VYLFYQLVYQVVKCLYLNYVVRGSRSEEVAFALI
jgi:hypothetical protein